MPEPRIMATGACFRTINNGYSLGGSDRITPSRTDANIPRSDPGLAVLMAFDIVRVGNSSTTSRSGKRAQPTNLAQGAQASRPSSMAFEASCAPAYTLPRSSFLIGRCGNSLFTFATQASALLPGRNVMNQSKQHLRLLQRFI